MSTKALLISVPEVIYSSDAEDEGEAFALPSRTVILGWQTSFGAVPGAADIDIEIAMEVDGPWTVLDTSTDTAGEFRTIADPVAAMFVRANVNDSSSEVATVKIVAKVANP